RSSPRSPRRRGPSSAPRTSPACSPTSPPATTAASPSSPCSPPSPPRPPSGGSSPAADRPAGPVPPHPWRTMFRWSLHGDGGTVAPDAIVLPEERLAWPLTIGIGAQHVIAMFGATFLVPVITGFPRSEEHTSELQ